MNCNIQILKGRHAGKDFDGTLTRLGKVVFYVADESGRLAEMVTNRNNPDIKVRSLQRVSLSEFIEKSRMQMITDAIDRDSE